MQLALGLIETKGLVGAIEAADAMAKAADVKIINKEKITAALVTIEIIGEVAAVRSALDAGAAAAKRVGQLVSVHIIPRPDDQLDQVIGIDHNSEIMDPAEDENNSEAEDSSEEGGGTETETPAQENAPMESSFVPDSDKDGKDESENDLPSSGSDETENSDLENGDIEQVDISQIDLNEIKDLSVNRLRRLARGTKDFPLKGRDISKASRQALIEVFRSMMQ